MFDFVFFSPSQVVLGCISTNVIANNTNLILQGK